MGRGLRPFRYVDKSELVLRENGEEETQNTSSEETEALVQEMDNPTLNLNQNETTKTDNNSHDVNVGVGNDDDVDTTNAVAILENIIPGVNEDDIKAKDQTKLSGEKTDEAAMQHENADEDNGGDSSAGSGDVGGNERFSAKFAKLILERNDRNQHDDDDDNDFEDDAYVGNGRTLLGDTTPTGRGM